ncbi:TlpA family protein disulfide reductase [Marinifilum sp.]|uniref:TlpA family protein disulfide reductase n=1 Tax=Marinifilum sp. TaxID=2033137 RepID=UPI003BAC3089
MNKLIWKAFFLILTLTSSAQTPISHELKVSGDVIKRYAVSLSHWVNGYEVPAQFDAENKGDTLVFHVPNSCMPCQLNIKFESNSNEQGSVSVSVFMANKDLHLAISDWRSEPNWHGDLENLAHSVFTKECAEKKQQLMLLQNFLSSYTDDDELNKQASATYVSKRKIHNQWVKQQVNENSGLWVSRKWKNQLITGVNLSSDKKRNLEEIIDHAFDFEDFKDTTLLNTDYYLNLINNYMSMNEMLVQVAELNRNSLMTEAGNLLAQKASFGDPRLYGWVVDYLFTNYERYSIQTGIDMLQQHINKPNCKTYKKIEINRRLKGNKKLAVGKIAPKLLLKNSLNEDLEYKPGEDKLNLLFFYESSCPHCEEFMQHISKITQLTDFSDFMSVTTVSLDDDFDIWQQYHEKQTVNWDDFYAEGGINGTIAKDYCLLSTPSIFLLDETNRIELKPNNIVELLEYFYDKDKVKQCLSLL